MDKKTASWFNLSIAGLFVGFVIGSGIKIASWAWPDPTQKVLVCMVDELSLLACEPLKTTLQERLIKKAVGN